MATGCAERGLSILELLVATILAAALLGAALLAYRPMLARWRLDAAARQVVLDLKLARTSAIAESADHRIRFPVPGHIYQRESRGGSGSYEPVGPETQLPFGVETIECTASASSITFRPRGHAATFGTIVLRNLEGAERRIVVDMAGRARVQ